MTPHNTANPPSQEWHLRGAAFGLAFDARMLRDNPARTPKECELLEWAEQAFCHLARDTIQWDEAVCGYGG